MVGEINIEVNGNGRHGLLAATNGKRLHETIYIGLIAKYRRICFLGKAYLELFQIQSKGLIDFVIFCYIAADAVFGLPSHGIKWIPRKKERMHRLFSRKSIVDP